MASNLHVVFFALILLHYLANSQRNPEFKDITINSGLKKPYNNRFIKYGGACVADLDGDGYLDLILANHDKNAHIYFNTRGNFKFQRAKWTLHVDAHGFNAFRLSPSFRGMHFIVSRGGARGTKPNFPLLYSVSPGRKVQKVHSAKIFDSARGRGRTVLPIYLTSTKVRTGPPDLIFTNAKFPAYTTEHNRILKAQSKRLLQFQRVQNNLIRKLEQDPNHYLSVTDVNGDGVMDVIAYQALRMYSRATFSNFNLKDVSTKVFPKAIRNIPGVRAVVELDYDNDGRWDLYISRSKTNDLKWLNKLSKLKVRDHLLRNVGGRYVDVTAHANIPFIEGTGCTAADFNNDGYIDILVTQKSGNDYMLLNQGNGKFKATRTKYGRIAQGDQPVAADFDLDGRIDVVLSEGDWFNQNKAGIYRLLKNVIHGDGMHWLLVRVKNAPGKTISSLHAVVTACYDVQKKEVCMKRRIGSPGTAVSNSYIETAHFGVGSALVVKRVIVKWVNGVQIQRINVKTNTKIVFGA